MSIVSNPKLLSANILICETTLTEKSGLLSAIRLLDTISIPSGNNFAHFYTMTFVTAPKPDLLPHKLQIQLATFNGASIAYAPEQHFVFGYRIDPSAPGGFVLTTEFTLDLRPLGTLGTYMIWAFLDGEAAANAPLTLTRR